MPKRRANGEGNIRKRKDGRWEGRVVIGYDDKGLPKTKNVLAKTKSECVEKLKTLKDQNGQYLWNQNSDTILGKPLRISEFMPSDGKPVAFGDFSYYYIIDRVPLTVRPLIDQYMVRGRMGYLGVEYLDGILIRPEAVKVLRIGQ